MVIDDVPSPAETLSGGIAVARGRLIRPKTAGQRRYMDAIADHTLVFGIGPAGTGKTYLAMAAAVAALKSGSVRRILLTRPAVEAGERLGFLPGDMAAKIDPYLRPLYDALFDMLGTDETAALIEKGTIEIAPLAYMRGRTLNDAYVILDEAQNTSPEQMKMFLTRLGFNSRMVITGDVTQVDLPTGNGSGSTGRSKDSQRHHRRRICRADLQRCCPGQNRGGHRRRLRPLRGRATGRGEPAMSDRIRHAASRLLIIMVTIAAVWGVLSFRTENAAAPVVVGEPSPQQFVAPEEITGIVDVAATAQAPPGCCGRGCRHPHHQRRQDRNGHGRDRDVLRSGQDERSHPRRGHHASRWPIRSSTSEPDRAGNRRRRIHDDLRRYPNEVVDRRQSLPRSGRRWVCSRPMPETFRSPTSRSP